MKRTTLIALGFLAFAAVPGLSQDSNNSNAAVAHDNLSMEQQTALRCSAAFALVARMQAAGDASVQDYPATGIRGKEFMVRSMAQLMDEKGFDRATISRLLTEQVQELQGNRAALHAVMPACDLLLEASGI